MSNKFLMDRRDSICLTDDIENCHAKLKELRDKGIKKMSGMVDVKIGVWNVQSLNKNIPKRYNKLEFLRDVLNDNKLDFIWLIDVNNTEFLNINGYKKYDDERSILFVNEEILDEFTISFNCIFSIANKLVFIYATPNSNDEDLLHNLKVFIKNGFTVIGDFNLKSNKKLASIAYYFTGEDTLQVGCITPNKVKRYSMAAPSDHRCVFIITKIFANVSYTLRLSEVSYTQSSKCIKEILDGKVPKFMPKVKIKQRYIGLSDREITINAMVDDYLHNNVGKIFRRYNYLWRFERREPFLGKNVPEIVKKTYAEHLREDKNKIYKEVPKVFLIDQIGFTNDLIVKFTKSKAINYEFISLENIPKVLDAVMNDPKNKNKKDVINNIIEVANKIKGNLIAECFFLRKARQIKDFNDVRVIVVMPTVIKMFETLIFDKVVNYLSQLIVEANYQFGGVAKGSTYWAMLKLKNLQNNCGGRGVVLIDLEKGYDTINLDLLWKYINFIKDNDVRVLLRAWWAMVFNMDLMVNNNKIRRTRGLPMGLSLSPIMFSYYVHVALGNIDKNRLIMYLDDIAISLSKAFTASENLSYVDTVLFRLQNVELKINVKKSIYISEDKDIQKGLNEKKFKRMENAKYLGRLVELNGDGKVIADDRFYNIKGFRSKAVPYWATFFIKRLVFVAALDAKLRYRMLMWATSDIKIRNAIWKNDMCFFMKGMPKYSYMQMTFSLFNIFRYFIDVKDVDDWKDAHKSNERYDATVNKIQDKLKADIPQIDAAVSRIRPKLIFYGNDIFDRARNFTEELWRLFKANMIQVYLEKKKEEEEQVFEELEVFCNSKLFNYFGILQSIVLLHYNNKTKSKSKEIFLIEACKALFKTLVETVIYSFYNKDVEAEIRDISMDKIFANFDNSVDEKAIKDLVLEDYDKFVKKEFINLWPFVSFLLEFFNDSKEKGGTDSNLFNDSIKNEKIVAYVDGACNGKYIGYGIYMVDHSKNDEDIYVDGVNIGECKEKDIRNVKGELEGAAKAVLIALQKGFTEILIVYDYYGIEKYATGEWKPSIPYFKTYISRMKTLMSKIKVKFKKVKSHSGIPGNEIADWYAKKAIGLRSKEDYCVVSDSKFRFNETQKDYLKRNFKIVFEYLTIIEMIYRNNVLNDLDYKYLMLNTMVKSVTLKNWIEKSYRISQMEEFMDPLEDGKLFDIFNQ